MFASYIRSLAATVRVFPEDRRNRRLTMSHHRIAAQTGSPTVWLQQAAEKKWSVRESQGTIKGRRDKEEYRAQVERLLRKRFT